MMCRTPRGREGGMDSRERERESLPLSVYLLAYSIGESPIQVNPSFFAAEK
ncbi:Hypothetical protein FKW44_015278 [Caligus rogercresseyi]|uniref:Uncharacterized protein n=1 Tax=Caligus rogercresseyi TaxID=217165 RepID=A0A7T8H0E4_CALRO|nr:Hypothetical protein FKW44_015278 [Caligus rogercresseyi]